MADDDPTLLKLTSLVLERDGHEVTQVINGQEVIAAATQADFDLILLDVMMPVMDGFQALDEIKRSPRLKAIPVAMVSARVGKEDKERCLKAGASAYVTKPFRTKDLLRVVHDIGAVEGGAADGVVHATKTSPNPTALDGAQMASILDLAVDAIVSVDESQRIIGFNKGAEMVFGYSIDEVIRTDLDGLIPERLRSHHGDYVRGFAGSGDDARLMGHRSGIWGRRKDGSEFPAEASIVRHQGPNGVTYTAILRDITDRRRNEAIRDAFLHAVSHDLRTPLTGVIGFAEMLTSKDVLSRPEEAAEYANIVLTSARRLERLMSDLLDLDRLSRGVVEPRRRPTDLQALVKRIVEEATPPDRSVTNDVGPELSNVNIDPAQVERIVENLLANVFRHTEPGTPAWVKAERVEEGLLVQVEDAGPGVPVDLRETIFEPFRRGSETDSSPGSGIGLSLVARFAELHDGRAYIVDRPGGGAQFNVILKETAAEA